VTDLDITPTSEGDGAAPGLEITPLDDTDREIVRLLQQDGRASNTHIGRALGLTETTIRKRLRRLLDDGVLSIGAMPSPQTVNRMSSVVIGLSVATNCIHDIADQLVELREVSYVGLSTGRFDIIVEAFFPDHKDVLDFITRRLGSMEGIRDVNTSLILEIKKFKYEWEMP
jgi:Lrp/AsnC family transcriptional regulator for asnA, asnC and gidA